MNADLQPSSESKEKVWEKVILDSHFIHPVGSLTAFFMNSADLNHLHTDVNIVLGKNIESLNY